MFSISLIQEPSVFLADENDGVLTSGMIGFNKSFLGVQGAILQKSPLAAGGKLGKNLSSDKSVKIGYNRGMESQDYVEGLKSGDRNYGPIMNSDSYEPNQQTHRAAKDSTRVLHIPADKIKRGYPEQKRMKRTNRKQSAKIKGTTNIRRTQSMINTYYIWSFDGRLMAEYNDTGTCTREYIYLGNRLLAEYHPPTDKYYYHFQDQINSTRIVTDQDGNVVYYAAHGPYGDIQKEWVNTYDPKQKFSGKERECYTDIDYFGARYYDNHSYRFISVDPIKNREEAIGNPQLWNLYAYCRNNPITFIDPNGLYDRKKAVDYALKYSHSTYPQYIKFSLDCANFSSQSVHAGEFRMNRNWYFVKRYKKFLFLKIRDSRWTNSWTVANEQFKYFSNPKYAKSITTIKSLSDIKKAATSGLVKPGDLLYWDFNSDSRMDHSTMITDIKKGKLFYSGHTSSRRNADVSRGFVSGNTLKIVSLKDHI